MKESFSRTILKYYRNIQYIICRRHKHGALSPGELCSVEPHNYEINKGDIVHPCVRYIPNGYLGYKWWLVYTPYYKSDASLENPILCVGDSDNEKYPTHWNFYYEVCKGHDKGYNSDPNLFYDGAKLYVYWRENQTDNCDQYGVSRATFVGVIEKDGIRKIKEPILTATEEHIDHEVSPAFIKFRNRTLAYAISVQFFSPGLRKLPRSIRQIINPILLALDLLGFYHLRVSYGITIWEGDNPCKPFKLKDRKQPRRKNILYQPWHIDVFEDDDVLYAVIQSNQCNADIILARSDDGETFTLYDKPLITNEEIKKTGIYKPSAITVNGQFHLLYTAQDYDNRSLNKLYHSSCDFKTLLNDLK